MSMRLTSRAALLALVVQAACAGSRQELAAPSLVGLWRAFDPSGEFPAECREATLEFRADHTVSMRSGAQQLTATYRVEVRPGGLLLLQDSVQTNGEPNCQGVPAAFVKDHYFRRALGELKGDTLRLRPTGGAAGPVFTLVRVR